MVGIINNNKIQQMENNYSVYQHVTPDNMYYFGQTNNIKRRWSNNGARYKGTALQPYIERYGWDNIQHIVLFENQTRENALWIENFLIETAQEDGVCINKQRSGLITKEEGYKQEYYEQNKDKILEKQKQYYEQNKDKFKEYYEQNKQQILEQQKQYYEQNKQQIGEQKKQYYEQNKDKRLEYQQQYYEQNKQQIRERKKQYYEQNKDKQKQYYEQNKDKKREYNRQYYQRKKEEQQLKELGCLPLF